MERQNFNIRIDNRGHHCKGITIYNDTKVSLQQKLMFQWTKNVFLNTAAKIAKNLYNTIFFVCSAHLFRATLY